MIDKNNLIKLYFVEDNCSINNLVSVVIPTYNRENTISRAVRSVLNQTYDNIEIVIVDDCSNDHTEEVVKKEFGNNPKVLFHTLDRNSGACVARNKGVQLSHGEYIAFLDSDDEFQPEKISKQIACLERDGVSLCATDYTSFDKNGHEGIVKTHPGTRDAIYKELLYCNFITTGTLMGYRKCFIDVPFDETLPRYQDWDLVLRLAQKYKYHFLEESTLLQYYQPVSITASTNHVKTLSALNTVYYKNIEGYLSDKRAFAQIHWLMGIHKLFINRKDSYKDLWIGVIKNGFNLHRFFIYIYIRLGFIKLVSKYI